jgi:hypothetical protein
MTIKETDLANKTLKFFEDANAQFAKFDRIFKIAAAKSRFLSKGLYMAGWVNCQASTSKTKALIEGYEPKKGRATPDEKIKEYLLRAQQMLGHIANGVNQLATYVPTPNHTGPNKQLQALLKECGDLIEQYEKQGYNNQINKTWMIDLFLDGFNFIAARTIAFGLEPFKPNMEQAVIDSNLKSAKAEICALKAAIESKQTIQQPVCKVSREFAQVDNATDSPKNDYFTGHIPQDLKPRLLAFSQYISKTPEKDFVKKSIHEALGETFPNPTEEQANYKPACLAVK